METVAKLPFSSWKGNLIFKINRGHFLGKLDHKIWEVTHQAKAWGRKEKREMGGKMPQGAGMRVQSDKSHKKLWTEWESGCEGEHCLMLVEPICHHVCIPLHLASHHTGTHVLKTTLFLGSQAHLVQWLEGSIQAALNFSSCSTLIPIRFLETVKHVASSNRAYAVQDTLL